MRLKLYSKPELTATSRDTAAARAEYRAELRALKKRLIKKIEVSE